MNRKTAIGVTVVLVSVLLLPNVALAKFREETARIRPDFTIVIDGTERNFKRADGSAAYALVYNDNTYLPLRAIGEALGKNVNWEESTKTITIEGKRTASNSSNQYVSGKAKNVTVQVRTDFTIVIDGVEQCSRTSSGKTIYPLLYNGSTYLPLRAIGEIMEKEVRWHEETKTVTLTGDGFTVTDADNFNTSQTTQKTEIGMEKAKKIALQNAGLSEKEVDFLEKDTSYEDGKKYYEISFVYQSQEDALAWKYTYKIDAQNGKILEFDGGQES